MIKHLFMAAALTLAMASCTSDDPKTPEVEPETPETPQTPDDPDTPDTPAEPETPAFAVYHIDIDTQGAEIVSKEEYIPATVTIEDPDGNYAYTGTAGVRGRGNSTWFWYPKKPYRIKLDKKASLFGMGEGKSWVLLANYRDPTDLMNTFVFELGQQLGMPFTNHTMYVELTLNGNYNGLYQFTEQVQQGKGRVNVNEKAGYLLSLDADDGPDLSPDAGDNFWSAGYRMPVCVKNPEDQTAEQLDAIRTDLATLESAILNADYDALKDLMDVQSYIDFIMLQELVYNVELDAPRSMYIHRDKDGKWAMGPLWDFDAGYDFDWADMYTGHNFFSNYKELVLGTDPVTHKGTGYRVPGFFSDMFRNADFKHDYKQRWRQVKAKALEAWSTCSTRYYNAPYWEREQQFWPIGKNCENEIKRMGNWLQNRIVYLDEVINNY